MNESPVYQSLQGGDTDFLKRVETFVIPKNLKIPTESSPVSFDPLRRSAGSIIPNGDWDRFPGSDHFGHGNDHFQLESQLTILSRVCGGSE